MASIAVYDDDGGESHVLPGAHAVLGFQLRGEVHAGGHRLSPIGVTGIQPGLRTYRYAPGTRSVIVRFTHQGARCLGAPASSLTGKNVALADLLAPAVARELAELVARAGNTAAPRPRGGGGDDDARDADAISRVDELVTRLLAPLPFALDPVVERAIALLAPGPDDEERRVAAVARALGLGERQLERRFRDRVGMSPQRFVSLRRFERAVALSRTSTSLTRAALDAGYYDQPHFTRDFRRFTGMSPRAWLRISEPPRTSDPYK